MDVKNFFNFCYFFLTHKIILDQELQNQRRILEKVFTLGHWENFCSGEYCYYRTCVKGIARSMKPLIPETYCICDYLTWHG